LRGASKQITLDVTKNQKGMIALRGAGLKEVRSRSRGISSLSGKKSDRVSLGEEISNSDQKPLPIDGDYINFEGKGL